MLFTNPKERFLSLSYSYGFQPLPHKRTKAPHPGELKSCYKDNMRNISNARNSSEKSALFIFEKKKSTRVLVW